ncbi:MAG: hypothetical protein JWP44_4178 [Mucilaginibacter sp.]|nr:hypothetical protein [Mucilaginibacter sp.]
MSIIRVNKMDDYDIFIGRPSRYSNPFIKGIDGTRGEVIDKFENYIRNHPELNMMLDELSGNKIACWCNLNQNCHGDVFITLLEEREKLLVLNNLVE